MHKIETFYDQDPGHPERLALARTAHDLAAEEWRGGREPIGPDPGPVPTLQALHLGPLASQLATIAWPTTLTEQSLQLIGRIGAVFATDDAMVGVESFGLALASAAVLLHELRLGIGPVLALAEQLVKRSDVQPIAGPMLIASAVASRQGWTRNREIDVVYAVAVLVAKGLDDCTLKHEVAIRPLELYARIAGEVIDGKLGLMLPMSAGITTEPPAHVATIVTTEDDKTARKAAAVADYNAALAELQAEPGDPSMGELADLLADSYEIKTTAPADLERWARDNPPSTREQKIAEFGVEHVQPRHAMTRNLETVVSASAATDGECEPSQPDPVERVSRNFPPPPQRK